MDARDFVEVLCAAHLSAHLEGKGFDERGGIMVVAPPGAMKTTFLSALDRLYPDVMALSDLNAKALTNLRETIAGGQLRTLIFPEFQKLYMRKAETSSNLEGALQGLVSEGFRAASFEPQGVSRLEARALVLGAMTMTFRDSQIERWNASGFSRRFLWPLFRLSNPEILDDAVLYWERLDFRIRHLPQVPLGSPIPNRTTREERSALRMLCKYQPGGAAAQQYALLVKMHAVLKWWYDQVGRDEAEAMRTMEQFGVLLGPQGGVLNLPVSLDRDRRQARKESKQRREAVSRAAARLAAAKRNGKHRRTKK